MSSRPLVLTFSFLALHLSLAAPAAVATADAQQQQQGPLSKYRFQALDDNRDGRISRDEWDGNERSFRNHDWNGDGVLSGNEVRTGYQRDTELADHEPNRFERNLNWTRNNFTALDHNRDGRISANEWHYDVETFRRVDANRNDSLSLQEFLGEGVEDVRDNSFDDMDWNNNGRVERTEWYGGNAEFNRLDANRDGVLSRYEVVGSTASFDTWDQFQNLDYDRNGSLSRAEWHWSNASFTSRDRNRDGIISRQEFEVAGGAPAMATSAAGSQTIRVNAQQRWTDTGLNVRAGDVITFNVTGTITMSDDQNDTANWAGSTRGRTAPDAPVLGQKAGGLLAKIGEYSPSFVGGRSSWTAPVSGRLYLGVNDDHLADNRGEFTVTVGVQGRTLR
jgi:Ca2+-binding EF-hand superfamily protein